MLDPLFVTSNYLEAGLWTVLGVGFAVTPWVSAKAPRTDCLITAGVFVAFGASDIVETTTGAWWRPWWLFTWKAVCVIAFVGLLARHYRRKRRRATVNTRP